MQQQKKTYFLLLSTAILTAFFVVLLQWIVAQNMGSNSSNILVDELFDASRIEAFFLESPSAMTGQALATDSFLTDAQRNTLWEKKFVRLDSAEPSDANALTLSTSTLVIDLDTVSTDILNRSTPNTISVNLAKNEGALIRLCDRKELHSECSVSINSQTSSETIPLTLSLVHKTTERAVVRIQNEPLDVMGSTGTAVAKVFIERL